MLVNVRFPVTAEPPIIVVVPDQMSTRLSLETLTVVGMNCLDRVVSVDIPYPKR